MTKLTKLILIIVFLWTVDSGLPVLRSLGVGGSTAYAEVPHLINYQARLTDQSGDPLEGSYQITFRIYDAASAGNLLWHETQDVLIQKGIFSVLLGSVTDLDLAFDQAYWLAIKVGQDSEMSPRQEIASTGYAIRAETSELALEANNAAVAANADKLDGLDFTGHIAILTGTAAHGATIPLPAGYTQQQCKWLVAIGQDWSVGTQGLWALQCWASENRVVTARGYWYPSQWNNKTAEYLIIGIK